MENEFTTANKHKLFIAIWGAGYTVSNGYVGAACRSMDSLSSQEGYTRSDIDALKALPVHGVWRDSSESDHYIVRVR